MTYKPWFYADEGGPLGYIVAMAPRRASDGLLGAGRFRAAIQFAQDKFLQETVEVDLEKAQIAA